MKQDKKNQYRRAWYAKNRESILKRERAWYRNHRSLQLPPPNPKLKDGWYRTSLSRGAGVYHYAHNGQQLHITNGNNPELNPKTFRENPLRKCMFCLTILERGF